MHARYILRSGRSFLRRIIDLLHAVHHHHHSKVPIRLNKGFRSDLAWWSAFVRDWNGVSFLHPPDHLPEVEPLTDASGNWGCRAVHDKSWFQFPWDTTLQALSIVEKELIPIILACATWGASWRDCQVTCHCDSQVIVACLQSRTSKNAGIMHLLRCLVFVEARHHCYLRPAYIDTKSNNLADDLSRNNFSFLSKVPGASPMPSLISPNCWEISWTSKPIGHQIPDSVSSAVFSAQSSPFYPEILPGSNETFSLLLQGLQYFHTFSCHRTAPLFLRSIPGRLGPCSPDCEILLIGSL